MTDDTQTTIEQSVQSFAREAGRVALGLQKKLADVSSKDGEELTASNIVTEADEQVGQFAEDFFFACPQGEFERLSQYVELTMAPPDRALGRTGDPAGPA